MSLPEWIDQRLSEQLPILRDRGEGQNLEFMAEYPSNGHDLSREIAAFASSNAGTILIGVSDDGNLIGLCNVDTAAKRDTLLRRIEGVCAGHVRPAITPTVNFAQENNAVVLVIEVPRGRQPIYYSKHTPYVRHLTQSRPAEPHEVIERITDYSKATPLSAAQEDADPLFFSSLAEPLIDALIYGEELEDRNVNPWMDLVRAQFRGDAASLRQLASEDIAAEKKLDIALREIADKLDSAANHRLYLGADSWKTLTTYISDALDRVRQVKADYIDSVPLSADATRQIRDLIRRSVRELADLNDRAERLAEDGRIEEVQSEASSIGYLLLRVSHYRIGDIEKGFTDGLRAISRDLHLLETERLYLDGGQSMARILSRLHELTERLQALISDSQT
jgi:ATP-dependent DNA helicase RecG